MSESELADAFLPVYDVSDAVAAVVEADRQTAWQALLDVDMLRLGREAAPVGMLGALRMLPEVLGHPPPWRASDEAAAVDAAARPAVDPDVRGRLDPAW